MTPDFSIIVDGSQDITEAIRSRLLSLEFIDQNGIESDTLTIEIADDARLELPREGAKITLSMGYVGELATMGVFVVDKTTISGPPAAMMIHCHAADMRQTMKQRRTKAWESVTLADCLASIAEQYGLTATIHQSLATINIARMDQLDESDMNFLTRLARQYQAVFKVAGDNALMMPIGTTQNAAGAALPVVSIPSTAINSYHFTTAGRSSYSGATAKWRNVATGTTETVSNGVEPFHSSPRIYATRSEAAEAVKTMQKQDANAAADGYFTTAGDTRLMFGTSLSLPIRAGLPASWTIVRAKHAITADGYQSTLQVAANQ